jgi:hypothetical protein
MTAHETAHTGRGWVRARAVTWDSIAGPLRHRLANVAAPLGVLVELAGDGADISRMTGSAQRCLGKLERTYTLLGALAGRVRLPVPTGATVTYELAGTLPSTSELPLWLGELAANAAHAGARTANVTVTTDAGNATVTWSDDGAVLDDLGWFGDLARHGEGGCGLGLAAIAAQVRNAGGVFEAHPGTLEKFRFTLPL